MARRFLWLLPAVALLLLIPRMGMSRELRTEAYFVSPNDALSVARIVEDAGPA